MFQDWLTQIVQALVAATVLFFFFRLTETKWPGSYYSVDDAVDRTVSKSPWRYALFRFGPVYIVAILLGDLAEHGVQAIAIAAVLHVASTSAAAIIMSWLHGRLTKQIAAAHLAVASGIFLVAVIAVLTLNFWVGLLPDGDKYVESLLTAVFAATIFFAVGKLTSRSDSYVTGKSHLLRLPESDISCAVRSAANNKVDRDLVLTILIAEGLQRPAWFRRLERIAGKVGLAKTFGPMQGGANVGSTDAQAIDEAIRRLRDIRMPRPGGYTPKQAHLQWALEQHNKSVTFIGLGEAIYAAISQEILANSEYVGEDGTPGLRLLSRRRVQDTWVLFGDRSEELEVLTGAAPRGGGDASDRVSVQATSGRYRPTWRVTASIYDDQLVIGARRSGDSEDAAHLQVYL